MESFTTIILAGGKSSRMGQDKGLMIFNGKPMIEHILIEVKSLSKEVIIISNNCEYDKFGVPIYNDIIKDIGPIGGILTGLEKSKTGLNLVLTCDSPFLSQNLIKILYKNHKNNEITYPVFNGKRYPLTAFYKKSNIKLIKEQIRKSRLRVKDLLNLTKSKIVELDSTFSKEITNLNTPQDLGKFI